MHEKIARIDKAMLGYEDHGILTAMLTVDYGGSGQGVGGYVLDRFDRDTARRRGAEFGMEWIVRCMRACGVTEWSQIVGRTIFVLRESEDYNARVVGIRPLPFEDGEEFIFADLAREFEETNA